MTTASAATPSRRDSSTAWQIALAGAVSLAVAMGIGRFAFTPLLPMMLHDGVIDLPSASWLASANYLGYLAGALLCTFQPWIWTRLGRPTAVSAPWLVRAGLVATALLTLGMALPWSATWPLLRFAAGVASALVFVYTSGWCLARLTTMGAGALGGVIYTGPGAGIMVSGLFATAMVAWSWTAAAGWLIFGALAALLTAGVWMIFHDRQAPPAAPVTTPAALGQARADIRRHGRVEVTLLALAYGLAGFGYIITATFLPVIARQALPGSAWLDMFWPILGLGVVVGALLATRVPVAIDRRLLLLGAYLLQAAGIVASLWSPSLVGFAIGSFLLGLPFTALTFFAMQEVRRLRPALAAPFMGLLTAVYGVGQFVGPPLVALLLRQSASVSAGFTRSLEIAAAALLCGALMYAGMVRIYPLAAKA